MSKPMLYAIPLVLPGCSLFPTTDVECLESGRCIPLSETMPKDAALPESDMGVGDLPPIADLGGNHWSPVSSTGSKLNAIHGVVQGGVTEVFAVGNSGAFLYGAGTSFKQAGTGPGANNLTGVYTAALKQATVIDEAGKISSTTTQGSSWTTSNLSASSALYTITGKSSAFITAGADLKIGIYSNTKSGTFTHSAGESIYASCVTPSYWYIAGDNGMVARASDPSQTWTTLQVQGTRRDIRGIWGASDNNLWAVGTVGRIANYKSGNWQTIDLGSYAFAGIWGSSANDIWVVGSKGSVYHYDGNSWQPATNTSLMSYELTAVWGDSKGGVWVTGNGATGGTIFKY